MSQKCLFDGCKIHPYFGLELGKPVFCSKHKEEGMLDVKNKKCPFNDCKSQPTFGFEWGKPISCAKHKEEGMLDVKHKKCRFDGCKSIPYFGLEWGKALFCSKHKEEGMLDVKHKKCRFDGCKNQPYFGLELGKPVFCSKHKEEGMLDVKNKKCRFDGCKYQPTFGLELGKPIFCSKHKEKGMLNVRTKKCRFDGCKSIPNFGLKLGKPVFCFKHKEEGMLDVKNKKCRFNDCKSQPRFGTHLTGKIHCSKHVDKKSEWRVTRCKYPKCKQIAIRSKSGNFPFEFCDSFGHYPVGYTSSFVNVCKGCMLSDCIVDEEGLCLDSCTVKHSSRQKLSENEMEIVFNKARFSVGFIRDAIPQVSGCIKERPDFVFDLGYGILIVENDENQHRGRLKKCESDRMVNIHSEYGQGVHFIRFNPHRYDNGVDNVDINKRYVELVKIVGRIIRDRHRFFEVNPYLTVRYMFYDGQLKGEYPINRIEYL